MWVLCKSGFVSIVKSYDDDDTLMVRARSRDDLVTFVGTDDRATYTPDADYPWKTKLPAETVARLLADEAEDIDYPNFKDMVTRRFGKLRHDLYARVWATLTNIEREPDADVERAQRRGMARWQ